MNNKNKTYTPCALCIKGNVHINLNCNLIFKKFYTIVEIRALVVHSFLH